ncbi:UDP-N-acetylmuramoyl-L-alanine--D-glutamate ligase [Bacillus piscicola]|uniref:UDP-N-acetylmuramoyl-L-alanine--D-glutamate ligase n=1 Tax=Bacillus piscicola TaxID=1632684 RepID=UPI001F08B336|nr:UDP-N-acetylmuramoyl-L-alanine--D-glutamate ligase [Bacillus piscicola]
MNGIEWFDGKKVLIIGLAKSGMAAARVLRKYGAVVVVNDAQDLRGSEEEKTLTGLGITLVSGSHPLELVDEVEYVVKNPGIRYDNPLVQYALEKELPVVTEIELAGFLCRGDMIAISGSNGKTTTTHLIHDMLEESGKTAYLAGNIGKAACEVAEQVQKGEIMVTEVSSFQLKGTETFHPQTAVLLNIFDAHLDYHGSRHDYERSKGKLFRNMDPGNTAVYNSDDPVVTVLAKQSRAALLPFSTEGTNRGGAYVKDDIFYFQEEAILPVKEAALPGKHNQENMLAAIAAAMIHGADIASVQKVLRSFKGIEHRLQFLKTVDGRRVYNDSKATNILSTKKAIQAFENPIVLIAGGLDRGNSFTDLIPALQNVKAAVFYGETKQKLTEAAKKAGVPIVEAKETLADAVPAAFSHTDAGDVLLLSPACASWDQFKTFEERGNHFARAVDTLGNE